NIKVGTRMRTTDFNDKEPETLVHDETDPTYDIIALNESGNYWKFNNDVPRCYLIIRIAIDGKNFSEPIAINPPYTSGSKYQSDFSPYGLAGNATSIEIRQLPPFLKYKHDGQRDEKTKKFGTRHDNAKFIHGINNTGTSKLDQLYVQYTWWGYPMGHI
ncbi:MAG: hypothetical protein K2M12_00860, partial [Muribaculaceae bacterium]|nr:hypothetical protein [Muribaculaceae bacterium]